MLRSNNMKTKKVSFNEYYSSLYKDRWPILKEALLKNDVKVIKPIFQNLSDSLSTEQILNLDNWQKGDGLPKDNSYIMDPASIIAASSLTFPNNAHILDMCAAPGGKSLILLEKIAKQNGTLWSNEISAARRDKLKNVIRTYVPENFREKVYIKGKDGIRYGLMHPNFFDAILLDAPCSGERHLLHEPKELAKWSIKRTKRLAKTQYALLCSALLSVKQGGNILYSTCSLSPLENDDVIERLLDKKKNDIKLNKLNFDDPRIEETKYGHIILPDKSNFGPIYFASLQKRITSELGSEK